MGADSAGVSGYQLQTRTDAKVFQRGDMVIGFTSSFRMGQLLHYAFTPPPRAQGVDLHRYMVVDFIDAVRECLRDGGYARKEDEQEQGGNFLVGYAGQLFVIEHDYQVGIMAAGYAAVGSGEQVALGTLYATRGRAPQKRILLALEAAAHFNAAVRGPFTVLST